MRWVLAAGALVLASAACGGQGDVASIATPDPGGSPGSDGGSPEQDAGGWSVDEPILPPASCGGLLPAGQTRASIDGVVGGVAIDADGVIYAPFETDAGELALVALDACGNVLWQAVVARQMPRRTPMARLLTEDIVVLDAADDFDPPDGLWFFSRDGEALPPWPRTGRYAEWLGADDDAFYLEAWVDDRTVLSKVTASGETHVEVDFELGREECALSGRRLGCYLGAVDTDGLQVAWARGMTPIIDGTMRHGVPPAIAGDRLYGLTYGIRTYRFHAQSLETGDTLWSADLGPSPSGQSGLVTGSPVVGETGLVYAYIAYRKDAVYGNVVGDIQDVLEPAEYFGWLVAFDEGGAERWRFEAPAHAEEFWEHATHVVGRGGVVYLAAGGVWALDAETGAERWSRTDVALIRRPRIALSPNGDLLVQSHPGVLHLIATDSAGGAAVTPWPAPGGDRRNRNGR